MRNQKANREKDKKSAREALDDYTETVLSSYSQNINNFLRGCGAAFRIANVKTAYAGGEPRSDYQIEVQHCALDVSGKRGSTCPTFRSVLSDGDKRTLAFAFFVAKLEGDKELNEKIIVCDDPVSSLDIHRQSFTLKRLMKIGQHCKQMIVMTHDPYFARRLWDEIRKDGQIFQIHRSGDFSKLGNCDIEGICQSPFAHNMDTLYQYLSDGKESDLMGVAKCIRPLIEGYLRLFYPREFSTCNQLGNMIKAIRDCTAGSSIASLKPQLEEVEDINDYALQFHHDENPTSYQTPIADAELKGYVDRTLSLIRGI